MLWDIPIKGTYDSHAASQVDIYRVKYAPRPFFFVDSRLGVHRQRLSITPDCIHIHISE